MAGDGGKQQETAGNSKKQRKQQGNGEMSKMVASSIGRPRKVISKRSKDLNVQYKNKILNKLFLFYSSYIINCTKNVHLGHFI